MKEDVLEQVVDDYLKFQGYFTVHNVRFKPRRTHPEWKSREDSVPSDIDVVGFHPRRTGRERVIVVNCKAWQRGLDAIGLVAQLQGDRPNPKRARWKQFRELWVPKWNEAFKKEIRALTGQSVFEYRIAVTRLRGHSDVDAASRAWSEHPVVRRNLGRSTFGFLTMEEIWGDVLEWVTTTPAPSELGRLAQLLKAAGLTAPETVAAPSGPTPGSDAAIEEDRLEHQAD